MLLIARSFLMTALTVGMALSSVQLKAEDIPDLTVEPGKKVGLITRQTTLEQLQKAYGEKNVKDTEVPAAEGETIRAAVVFEGTPHEIHVVWDFEKPGKEVAMVDIIGKGIVVNPELKVGSSIKDVEKANGAPFKLQGFGWDLGGYANFEGGKLANKVMIRFGPTVESYPDSISGDIELSSQNKDVLKAKAVVQQLSVFFD